MNRGQKVCDLVKGNLDDFKRLDMSAEDKNKVDVWETLCNDMGTIIAGSNQCTTAIANGIGGTSTNANKTASNITSAVTTDLDGADMYSVMAVLATMCNYNPVIFLKYPPNYVYSGIGITADSHNLSHRLDNAGMSGELLPELAHAAANYRQVLHVEVREADRHARRDQEQRRVDAPRQLRRGLVQRDVGRQRA